MDKIKKYRHWAYYSNTLLFTILLVGKLTAWGLCADMSWWVVFIPFLAPLSGVVGLVIYYILTKVIFQKIIDKRRAIKLIKQSKLRDDEKEEVIKQILNDLN